MAGAEPRRKGDRLGRDIELIERVHREEWAWVVATHARSYRDLDVAEEAAAEAFARAVERWPADGVPANPGAWLVTVGRNAALDRLRRESTRAQRQAAGQRALDARSTPEADVAAAGPLVDDRLRLVFTCCHPALADDAQIALTLRLVGGLTTAEVARAFWVPEATMAQRLVRAKRKIAAARIPYRVPGDAELPDRLAGVLRVVYLVFREGYSPSGGSDLVRVDVCDEAVRLARLVHDLLPDESEAEALLALLLLHHSRRDARTDGDGAVVLLADQDRTRWDAAAIREGLARTARALRAGRGPYALQAGIAACHAGAPSAAEVNWPVIAQLYGELERLDPSPSVVVNRAVAVAEVEGPAAGLAVVDALLATPPGEGMARTSHQPHVARAEMLVRLGQAGPAAEAYRRAITLAPTDPERRFLVQRLAELP